MKLKKIITITLIVSLLATLFSMIAFAEGEKPKVYLADITKYQVERNKTELVVPICVEGEIDMQCFDITVTYDKSSLTLVPDKTGINMTDEEFSYYDMNTETDGKVVFAGVTVDETMKSKTGTIGQLTFTSKKRISKDGTTTALGLSVAELGLGTEVADIEVKADATITMNVSEDPNATEPTEPTESTEPTKPTESTEPTKPTESTEPSGELMIGDVNQDESVTAADALMILQHAAKLNVLEGDPYIAANVNGDDVVNASDALEVLRYAAHLIDHFGN